MKLRGFVDIAMMKILALMNMARVGDSTNMTDIFIARAVKRGANGTKTAKE